MVVDRSASAVPSFTKRLEPFFVALILIFTFYMAMIPRMDYPYPIHVDEWGALGTARFIGQSGRLAHPLTHVEGGRITIQRSDASGFVLLLLHLKEVTGLSWFSLNRYLPALLFMLIVLQVYILGRRLGFGLEAALFASLIPTTVQFLGPAFAVPVSLGLLYMPLVLFLVSTSERLDARLLLLLTLIFGILVISHGTSTAPVGIVAILALLLRGFAERPWRVPSLILVLSLGALLPLLLKVWAPGQMGTALVWFQRPVASDAEWVPSALPKWGNIPLALTAVGVLGSALVRGWQRDVLILTIVILAAFQAGEILSFTYRNRALLPFNLYARNWLYLTMAMSLGAGLGLKWLEERSYGATAALAGKISHWYNRWRARTSASPQLQNNDPRIPRVVSSLAYLVSALLVLALSIAAVTHGIGQRHREVYYRIIGTAMYRDFVWIEQNLPGCRVVVMEPSMAITFPLITGKFTYSSEAPPQFTDQGNATREFFTQGARDTRWLRQRGIDMVWYVFNIDNPDLLRVRTGVYVLPECLGR